MPSLPPEFEPAAGTQNRNRNTTNRNTGSRNNQSGRNTTAPSSPLVWSFNNPLLDGDSEPAAAREPANIFFEEEIELPQDTVDDAAHAAQDSDDPNFGLEMPLYNPLLD
jgi:hypothetical protein